VRFHRGKAENIFRRGLLSKAKINRQKEERRKGKIGMGVFTVAVGLFLMVAFPMLNASAPLINRPAKPR